MVMMIDCGNDDWVGIRGGGDAIFLVLGSGGEFEGGGGFVRTHSVVSLLRCIKTTMEKIFTETYGMHVKNGLLFLLSYFHINTFPTRRGD